MFPQLFPHKYQVFLLSCFFVVHIFREKHNLHAVHKKAFPSRYFLQMLSKMFSNCRSLQPHHTLADRTLDNIRFRRRSMKHTAHKSRRHVSHHIMSVSASGSGGQRQCTCRACAQVEHGAKKRSGSEVTGVVCGQCVHYPSLAVQASRSPLSASNECDGKAQRSSSY